MSLSMLVNQHVHAPCITWALFMAACGGDSATATPDDSGGPSGNSDDIRIVGVAELTGSTCEIAVSGMAPMRQSGVLDFVEGGAYYAPLVVQVASSTVTLSGVQVELTVDGGSIAYEAPWEDYMEATAVAEGYRASMVPFTHTSLVLSVGAELASAPRGTTKTAVANVRVLGTNESGVPVESQAWTYSITLCFGCLVEFPAEALVVQADGSTVCDTNVATPTCANIDCPCLPGSDVGIDCRLCASRARPEDVCLFPPPP